MADISAIRTEIDNNLDWMGRVAEDTQNRLVRASDAGAIFAAEVYRFMQDPEAVGTDTLGDAYSAFMAQHSANFAPPMAPTRAT